jgi:hypothetical protein
MCDMHLKWGRGVIQVGQKEEYFRWRAQELHIHNIKGKYGKSELGRVKVLAVIGPQLDLPGWKEMWDNLKLHCKSIFCHATVNIFNLNYSLEAKECFRRDRWLNYFNNVILLIEQRKILEIDN